MFWNRTSKYEIDTHARMTLEKIVSEERMQKRYLECEIEKAKIIAVGPAGVDVDFGWAPDKINEDTPFIVTNYCPHCNEEKSND